MLEWTPVITGVIILIPKDYNGLGGLVIEWSLISTYFWYKFHVSLGPGRAWALIYGFVLSVLLFHVCIWIYI